MNIKLIKKIRNITSISIEKCKKALEKNNFDLKKSIIYLKKNIYIKKKNPKEGGIFSKIKNNKAIIIQINCETDFTIKNIEIKFFIKKIMNYYLNNKNISKKNILNYFEKKKIFLISKFNENIEIKNICIMKGKYLTKYIHTNNRMGSLLKLKLKKKEINLKKFKKIAMHIVAMNPKFINKKKIPLNFIKKYIKKINLYINNKKNRKKILNKKINNICLLNQKFIFNDKISVKKYLKKNNIKVINFCNFKI